MPDVVIIDVSAEANDWRALLDRVRALPCHVLLTSATPPISLSDRDGLPFLPKADICRAAVSAAITPG